MYVMHSNCFHSYPFLFPFQHLVNIFTFVNVCLLPSSPSHAFMFRFITRRDEQEVSV